MRNYKKYRPTVIDLFSSFLSGEIKESDLISGLSQIELELRQGKTSQKGLWFKFFGGDTLATGINDISGYLYGWNSNNRDAIREDFKASIDNPKGLQIYYS